MALMGVFDFDEGNIGFFVGQWMTQKNFLGDGVCKTLYHTEGL
jgi:hypothetical protein